MLSENISFPIIEKIDSEKYLKKNDRFTETFFLGKSDAL